MGEKGLIVWRHLHVNPFKQLWRTFLFSHFFFKRLTYCCWWVRLREGEGRESKSDKILKLFALKQSQVSSVLEDLPFTSYLYMYIFPIRAPTALKTALQSMLSRLFLMWTSFTKAIMINLAKTMELTFLPRMKMFIN